MTVDMKNHAVRHGWLANFGVFTNGHRAGGIP